MNNGTPQYRPMILYVYRINLLITTVHDEDDTTLIIARHRPIE